MNARTCMIVDLEQRGSKRMFMTERVSSITRNKNGLWIVRFGASPKIFNYNQERLLYMTQPEVIDISDKGLYIDKKQISNVAELLRFTHGRHVFYHVTYANGYSDNLEGNDVYITRTPIDQCGGSTWEYLKKLADETGLIIGEADMNILSQLYEQVDVKRDNVPLAQYLGDKTKLAKHKAPKQYYYPFGCNASQKQAVEAALTRQVSIVQGPPGTGKTQTILNIVANLLLQDKTILIVSNNNSAVENVAEKLAGENLDFLVAQLGSRENKDAFINNQPAYPQMHPWLLDEYSVAPSKAQEALSSVSKGFDAQTRQALLKAEYDALLKEAKYNEMLKQDASDYTWLKGKSAAKLLNLLTAYRRIVEHDQKPTLGFRLKWTFSLGFKMFTFLNHTPDTVIANLEAAFYCNRKTEIERDLQATESILNSIDIQKSVKDLRSSSLDILKDHIAQRYMKQSGRRQFTLRDIKADSEGFLKEYPIVLSTTYSAKNCINNNLVFDYVIMDEASQVDIKTGALALSCALNAVIVGDDKQLPNVIGNDEAKALQAIQATYNVDDKYNAATNSFLQSCTKIFVDAPQTLLREHYRCHPKIIEFCNQHFYNGELVAMTTDKGEDNVLQVVRTVKGNHARGLLNQREIDVIVQEVMPQYANTGSVGIITPYRLQAAEINKALGQDIASTVHKYQGRECDTIIMSMVDNAPTSFSDDPNLMNVAISRAKTRLCIVTNGNEIPQESNLAQLIAYMQYNNFNIAESKLHSVFDLLYKQYTAERLEYESSHPDVTNQLSENLIYNLLTEVKTQLNIPHIEIVCHYPLSRLIADCTGLDPQEEAFVKSPFSHVDFLIYNSLTKQPLHTIEVDGWHFHKASAAQQSRDALKDQILNKYGLTPHRLTTNQTVNHETIRNILCKTTA